MKKQWFMSLMLFCLPWMAALAQQKEGTRVEHLMNFDWKFILGDVEGAEALVFDDSTWQSLDIPHDFQFDMPWSEQAGRNRGFKEMGVGWYRKTFTADPAWRGKRLSLDFEGIMLTGDVWLNGQLIGGTDYGYLGFEADVTDLVKYDAPNVIAVRADTGDTTDSRWYTGGGLFRDVHLVVKQSEVAVSRHGIFVTTPSISENEAVVSVQVEVDGIYNREYNLDILAEIYAPDGKKVGESRVAAPKKSKQPSVEVPLPEVRVVSPQLWSCETPNLYTAEVSLVLDGKVVDRLSERFGIRTIEYSKEFGLKLNGKKVFLKGVANHHDVGALGAAAFETSIARMMDRLKEFGFNHIRTSHNPYSEAFLEIADEKGILVVDELYDKWGTKTAWAGRKPWTELWWQNMIEWIKRDRNHPSVIMWSFGNELQFEEWRIGYPTRDWGVTAYRIMDVMAKRYDPTRKTTVAMYPARAKGIVKHSAEFTMEENIIPPELATVTDVASFNYCWNDYQKYLKHAPHMIMYQSEAVTNELAAPFFGMDYDKMVGLAYWGAIEYWGESNAWPKKGWNYSFFNHSLEPFPQAYLMKAIFTREPIVHIGVIDSEGDAMMWNDIVVGQKVISAHWNRIPKTNYNLYTYTNAEEVELFVNGRSQGVMKNTTEVTKRNVLYWKNIPYKAGKIVAVARNNGQEVARHELQTTGKAVRLVVEPENPAWKADGMDLQYVKVYAVDSKGRKVPTATGEVTFEVEGAGSLLAVDNGDHLSNDLYRGVSVKRLYKGFAMAILRSDREAGEVTLKVSVPGLKGVTYRVQTEKAE